MRLLPLLTMLLTLVPAGWAACEAASYEVELRIADFGTAYFRDLRVDSGRDYAELSGGVCMSSITDDWTVEADRIDVDGLREGATMMVTASNALVTFRRWQLSAETLTSDGRELVMHAGTFAGEGLSGSVEYVIYNLATGVAEGGALEAQGVGFRVRGQTVRFSGQHLVIGDATMTTCLCPGEPLYVLESEETTFDLDAESIVLSRGTLRLGGITLTLADPFDVTNQSLEGLAPPLVLEYVPVEDVSERLGYGLALLVPALELEQGFNVEFGVAGLNADYPLTAWGLARYQRAGADLVFGYTRGGGPRADASFRFGLNDWLNLTFAINNRHYADAHYLHEGLLTLATAFPAATFSDGSRLAYGLSLTAAASSQGIGAGVVMGPRLRSAVTLDYRLPAGPLGRLDVRLDASNTQYFLGRDSQYGLRLRPSWTFSRGPVELVLGYDWQLTNSASPFNTSLDRLSPIARASGSITVSGDLGDNATGNLRFRAAYNFLRFTSGERRGFEDLLLDGRITTPAGEWTLTPSFAVQLAGVLDPRANSDRLGYVDAGLAAERGHIELGISTRYHLGGRFTGLESLELYAAYPFETGEVLLVPFLALDFGPPIAGGGGPALTGHGLLVRWDSCCGLFEAGYRVHGGEFSATLSAEFFRQD